MKMLDGDLVLHAGISRTFKTLRARQDLVAAERLLVWDPKAKWAELDRCTPVRELGDLVKLIRATGSEPARIAYIRDPADRKAFADWAQAAYLWGQWGYREGIRTNVVAEDVATITAAGKAPDGFHTLLSMGLEFGISMHALTTAPAESEKTSRRNATLVRIGQFDRFDDAKLMAKELRIPIEKIDELLPLQYIERNRRTKQIRKFTAQEGQDWRPTKKKPFPTWVEVQL